MSTYPALQIGGDLNPCYFYFHELRYCSENNLFPKTQCQNEREDFLECHSRAKQNKLMAEATRQLRKNKAINVPTYDRENDRFVFDDGKIVSNTDPIFNRFKWM